ncbi:hypothetical protein CEXT_779451 [Caerostris extrusa]|uniref:Uncharacterized protein n=1 Tax=Caerostris extrusa TaxID=172846 RepID=A0AAV4XX18_CAEEX|nr:hypothetical protein CEXT_779451 [Caerostris extrusa]
MILIRSLYPYCCNKGFGIHSVKEKGTRSRHPERFPESHANFSDARPFSSKRAIVLPGVSFQLRYKSKHTLQGCAEYECPLSTSYFTPANGTPMHWLSILLCPKIFRKATQKLRQDGRTTAKLSDPLPQGSVLR